MKYLKNPKLMSAVLLVMLLLGLVAAHKFASTSADRLLLLVPDGTKFSDPKVTMWVDAGSEEGLHVVPMHDSEFLRPFLQKADFSGVILPIQFTKRPAICW